jgi:hypothetical protein
MWLYHRNIPDLGLGCAGKIPEALCRTLTGMTSPHTRIWATALLAVLLSPLGTGAEITSKFIWLSDLHFDPMADPKLIDALAEASVDQWSRILASSRPGRFSGFGEDTNWALLSSSLDAVRGTNSNVKFTVVTGDLLVHRFKEKFEAWPETAMTHPFGASPIRRCSS